MCLLLLKITLRGKTSDMQLQLGISSSACLYPIFSPHTQNPSHFCPRKKMYYGCTLFITVRFPGRRAYHHGLMEMLGILSEKQHQWERLGKEDTFLALSTHSWSVDTERRTTNGWTDRRGGWMVGWVVAVEENFLTLTTLQPIPAPLIPSLLWISQTASPHPNLHLIMLQYKSLTM